MNNSVNWFTWRSGISVQSDSILLVKPTELLFPLLLTLSLIIAMLSLLAVLRFSSIKCRVINCSACLIYKAPNSSHITPLIFSLCWLPISNWIQYKVALVCIHIVSGTVSPYPSDLLHLYSTSHSLRSASDIQVFHGLRVCRKTLGERSFQHIGPVIWNSLPCSAWHATSLFQGKTENPPLLF